ncbi:uncharacterized protein METZ01_LOCUS105306 [marine metagenome]|uniref:Uncharacterized protein n=1 Tax=marine metagenome TaxID=408172 RepID=A0A381WJ26_9ZZZZ
MALEQSGDHFIFKLWLHNVMNT